jgi:hypothetical protein
MEHNILHTVYLKHNTSAKSLTKQALAQIILKVVYQSKGKGIQTQQVRAQLRNLTGVQFDTKDIQEAISRLDRIDKKIHSKGGKHFINQNYSAVIDTAVSESKALHKNVIEYWFSKSDTYNIENGEQTINQWFEDLLIAFFKDYSYDWIRDLKPTKGNGKKKTPNIENLIDLSLTKFPIVEKDKDWLKRQFVNFIESVRIEDNDLLWAYGSSMFSATLLTARNYADEFSLEAFKDADFILDTNILMVLELEGYEKNYALDSIETTFEKLNISTKYLRISRDEYLRAIGPKRDQVLAAVQEYNFDVIREMDCPFVQTAIRRQCFTLEDFKVFFDQISDIPEYFFDSLKLICEDYKELNEAITEGESDEKIRNELNEIYKRRTNKDKREKPVTHDAGLYKGVEFLNKEKKTMILTKDSILREYAYENARRDEPPYAIGLDSLIQMMAINSGGTDFNSTDFAPLFSKLVKQTLIPEKDTFRPSDLDFILKTKIQISELPKEEVIKIAKEVNRLRFKGYDEEDIVLEIQRAFNLNIAGLNEEIEQLKVNKHQKDEENKRVIKEKENLESQLFKSNYKIALNELKGEISTNRRNLLILFAVLGLVSFACLQLVLIPDQSNNFINPILSFLLSIAASLAIMIGWHGKKLTISEKDKEILKKEVSNEITKSKQTA